MDQDKKTEDTPTPFDCFSLTQLYLGIVLTLTTTLLMTIGSFFFVVSIGILEMGVTTTFGFGRHSGQLIANTLEILFLLGWLPVIFGIRILIGQSERQTSLKLLYWCILVLILVALHDYFLFFNIYHESLEPVYSIVQLASVLPTLALYPLQLLAIRRIAKVFDNSKIQRQTHLWIWITPMLLVASITPVLAIHENFFWILIVVILVIAIQYWNMLEYLRRDLKKIIISTESQYSPSPAQ